MPELFGVRDGETGFNLSIVICILRRQRRTRFVTMMAAVGFVKRQTRIVFTRSRVFVGQKKMYPSNAKLARTSLALTRAF